MAVLVAAGALQLLLTDSVSYANVTMLAGLYAVGRFGGSSAWFWLITAGVGISVSTIDWTRDEVGHVPESLLRSDMTALLTVQALLVLLSWGAGRFERLRASLAAVRAQTAARERDHAVRVAILAEREQIARELHDVVGHALAMTAVNADAGRYLVTASESEIDMTAEARWGHVGEALEAFRAQASDALGETRTLLRDVAADALTSDRGPNRDLDALPGLIEGIRRSGREVRPSITTGDQAGRADRVGTVAFRILQEALTNAVKHGGDPITVEVSDSEGTLELRVENRIVAPRIAPGGGLGLLGMRERAFDLDEYVVDALNAGASGLLLKDAGAADLLSAVRSVVAGDAVIAPTATRRLLDRTLPLATDHVSSGRTLLSDLSARERDVLRLVARGLTNAEIAANLFVAESTVKSHINRLLAKLRARDRVHLVILAYEHGLAGPRRRRST